MNRMWSIAAFACVIALVDATGATGDDVKSWDEPTDELTVVWIVAGICTLLGVVVVIHEVYGHMKYYNYPKVQHYEVRMLYTMPVYGITALCGLVFPLTNSLMILVRAIFAASLIYNHAELLIAYHAPTGTEEERVDKVVALMDQMKPVRAHPPCCFMGVIKPGRFYLEERVLKPVKIYVRAVPVLFIIGLGFDQYGAYTFGANQFDRAWFWLNICQVLLTIWALSGLFTVTQVLERDIAVKRIAIGQKIAVHLVLGPCVMQELIVGIIAESGGLDPGFGLDTVPATAATIMNLMLCIECFLFGLVYAWAFGYKEYVEHARPGAPHPHWTHRKASTAMGVYIPDEATVGKATAVMAAEGEEEEAKPVGLAAAADRPASDDDGEAAPADTAV